MPNDSPPRLRCSFWGCLVTQQHMGRVLNAALGSTTAGMAGSTNAAMQLGADQGTPGASGTGHRMPVRSWLSPRAAAAGHGSIPEGGQSARAGRGQGITQNGADCRATPAQVTHILLSTCMSLKTFISRMKTPR